MFVHGRVATRMGFLWLIEPPGRRVVDAAVADGPDVEAPVETDEARNPVAVLDVA